MAREMQEQLDDLHFGEDEDWPEEDEQEFDEGDGDVEGSDAHTNGAAHACDGATDDGPDDLTCAICLGQIQPLDLALVKGCEHQYCVHCILQWAMLKEWCPQCKAPFSHLYTHRQLDGTPSDYPLEECVTLLKRARWFVEEHEARERAKEADAGARRLAAADAERRLAAAEESARRYHADGEGPPSPRDWCDFYEDMLDAELEEDEAIEEYYYSSAAGHARIVLGNRRWGHGGFMRSGRMYARPVNNGGASGSGAGGSAGASTSAGTAAQQRAPAGGKGKGKGKQQAAAAVAHQPAGAGGSPPDCGGKGKGRAAPAGPLAQPTPRMREKIPKSAQALHAYERDIAPAVMGTSPLGRSPCSHSGGWMAAAGAALGTSPGSCVGSAPGSGRRAKRNARRAAVDSGGALDFD